MSDKDQERLQEQLQKLESRLPRFAARSLQWLRKPSSRWIRIPVALLLMVGGIFGFLPILGLWMLPLGAVLIAQDVPLLRRPTARALVWAERRWIAWRDRRRPSP